MITTLTLSPSLDRTVVLERLDPDRVNRAGSTRTDAGGKGINVSLALAALGECSRAIYLAFEGSEPIGYALKSAGAESVAVACGGRLRTNLKIFDRSSGKTVEINEQNPAVGEETLNKVEAACRDSARDSDILVLSGSVPAGAGTDIYKKLAISAKQVNPNIKIILDSSGVALKDGLEAEPYLIKPNREELEACFGVKLRSEAEAVTLCREAVRSFGVKNVIVSLGAEGAIAVGGNEAYSAEALKVSPKSAQGAGDAMVAGCCLAILKGLSLKDTLRYGICAAAGAIELDGTAFCTESRFEELLRSDIKLGRL